MPESAVVESDTNITSDVDFLKAKEEERTRKVQHKRLSSGSRHGKRASLPSISLSGTTKNLLAGRFGDAFRKFEGGNNDSANDRDRSPSPSRDPINVLTPIAGSEATDLSDDRHGLDDTEDVSPEIRRELEKRKLEAEEKRVANAAAEYRRRLAEKGHGTGRDAGKATSIQNKVQSLLKENDKPATKAAAGYGRFTDANGVAQVRQYESTAPVPPAKDNSLRRVPSKPISRDFKAMSAPPSTINLPIQDPTAMPSPRPVQRPMAPPKPKVLSTRTGRVEGALQPTISGTMNGAESISTGDDWEANFSKRYPSLSGLEMVETDIEAAPKSVPMRTREV